MDAVRGGDRTNDQLHPALVDAVLRAATDYSIIATDVVGIVTVFNAGAERMLGYDAAEVVGRQTPEIFHRQDEVERRAAELGIEPGFDVFVAAARAGQSETREWTYVRKDGSTLPVSLSVTAVLTEGQPIGFLGIARDLSEEKRTQLALELSAQRFATVFNASPVPTAITRVRDGLIIMANPACLAALGWEADEFIGRTISEVNFWAYPERRQLMIDRLRADGRIRDMEEDIRSRDGQIKRVLTSIELIQLDGETCLVGLFYDVTERTALEVALRESEQRLRAFLDHAPALVSMSDREGRFVLVNHRMTEELGITAESVIGKTGHDVYPQDTARALDAAYRRVLDEAKPVQIEERLPTAGGEWRDYLILKFPLLSVAGEIQGVGTIATDITQTKRVQEEIRESEERFRQLAESIDTGFLLREAGSSTALYVSPAAERIFGIPLEELRRDPGVVFSIIHPEDRSKAEAAGRADQMDLEYRIVRRDGSTRWCRSRRLPVREGSRVVSTVEDITDRKLADLELQAARAEAERANRAKSEFLSRMSHELRTPLNAILGFGELLALDPLTPEQGDSVGHIRKAGRHLLALIDEVLDISRIETGELTLSLEPVKVDELVREAIEIIRPLTAGRRVSLSVHLDAGEGYVLADRQRLKQVLLNVLSNAVKYNREDGHVTVSCDSPAPERRRITVADTGLGISEANLDRLFTPFDRLGAEQSGIEGTGLGLALSKRLVEAMRGTIGADSRVGEGTTCWIELGTADAPRELEVGPAPAAPTAASLAATIAGTVLYVEDNLSNLQLVERIVARRPGVVLLSAMQGMLGLELAALHQPDLVLLDLNLPDMSGEEVLRRLRAAPTTAGRPIVVISADATKRQKERLLASGATDYLTKPFEVGRLLGWIDRALGDGALQTTDAGRPHEAGRVATPRSPTLDERQVRALRELDDTGDALQRIAELFLGEVPGRLDDLSRAASAGDIEAVRAAAHSLKGSARTIGASRLAAVASAIERGARNGRLPDEAVLADLGRAFDRARAAVSALVSDP